MANRAIYLAVSNRSSRQRGHFAIFVPNDAAAHLTVDGGLSKATGTIIQVIGEPVMQGYKLEFKRNCDCETGHPVQKLVPLGYIDEKVIFTGDVPAEGISTDSVPTTALERAAAQIPPPPQGQDARAPIDGVTTKRCQEWTIEYVQKLTDQGLISPAAPEKVQEERDPPTHGIFGYKGEDSRH